MSILFKGPAGSAPFRLGALRQDVVVHPAWQRARQECLATLQEGGRLTLCGLPGTGKTLLMQELVSTLRAEGRSVVLLSLCEPETVQDEGAVLLIDEADRLSGEQIRQLCVRPGGLALAGLPTLHERVARSIGLIGHVVLEPMTTDDVARVVAARLQATGRSPQSFAPEALAALVRRSGGLFRLVVILAGAGLFFAELRGANVVSATDVEEAAAMREAMAEEAAPMQASDGVALAPADLARWPRRAVIALVALMAMVGIVVHLAGSTGGLASADAARVDRAALETASATGSGKPAALSPKRALVSKGGLARRD